MSGDRRIPASEIRRVWFDPSLSTARAAAAVGLTRSNLWRRAKALGLPPRKPGRMFAITDRETFREMWLGGVRAADIARHFEASKASVYWMVARLGLPRRSPGGKVLSIAAFQELQLAARMRDLALRERRAIKEHQA